MAAGNHVARGANGVRLNPAHDERTRAKIQTSQLINRLQAFIKSQVELSPAQVTAALGLLRKTLPDLAAVEHSGESGVTSVKFVTIYEAKKE